MKKGVLIIFLIIFLNSVYATPGVEIGDDTVTGDYGVNIPTPPKSTFSNGSAYVNSSEWWITNAGDLDNVNTTQMEDSGGILNILQSWLNAGWCALTGCDMTGNLSVDGNVTATGYGQFSWLNLLEGTEPQTPPADTLSLYVVEQDGFSRINYKDELGVSRTINDDEIIVNNSKGSTIAAHRLVYVTGYDAGVPTVNLARADNLSTMPSICVTIESIADAQLGRCMMSGLIQDVNTDSYDVGVIYVSDVTAGVPTNTAPITPNLTQEIGSILVKSATVGEIQILARALTGDEFGTINNFTVASGSFYFGDGSQLTGISGMDYTNLAMVNESNTFTENQIFSKDVNITQNLSVGGTNTGDGIVVYY